MPFFVRFPLAAVLLGDDAEGRLCVRKTPGAMGWEARPAWDPENVPAAVYSWSARLLLCDSGGGSGELPSCEAWLLAVLVEAGVVDAGVVEAEVVPVEAEAEVEMEGEAVLGAGFLLVFFFFLFFCSSCWDSLAAAAASPVSMEATLVPSRTGLSCLGTDGPTLAVGLYGASSEPFLFFDRDLKTGLSSSDSSEG